MDKDSHKDISENWILSDLISLRNNYEQLVENLEHLLCHHYFIGPGFQLCIYDVINRSPFFIAEHVNGSQSTHQRGHHEGPRTSSGPFGLRELRQPNETEIDSTNGNPGRR